jgi:hypothetical protein
MAISYSHCNSYTQNGFKSVERGRKACKLLFRTHTKYPFSIQQSKNTEPLSHIRISSWNEALFMEPEALNMESVRFLQGTGNHLHCNMVTHPTKLEISIHGTVHGTAV